MAVDATTLPAARQGSGKVPPKIQDLLEKADTKKRMLAILPKHLSPDRMLRVSSMAIWRTPKLGQCHPMTLLGAIMTCGTLGLEPNTPLGHAYILPFENRNRGTVDVTLIIGYTGYIDLARRSGKLVSIHADVIREGDDFDYAYGTEGFLKHRPGFDRDAGGVIGSYCYMRLSDGEGFRVLPLREINAARARSKSSTKGPWVTDFDAMASKTAVRRLARFMPLSLEVANAVQVDDATVDYRAIAESGDSDILNLDASAYVVQDGEENGEGGAPEEGEKTGEAGPAQEKKAEARAEATGRVPEPRRARQAEPPPPENGDPLFGDG